MAYKQRWLAYFERLDADKSGFVDPNDTKYYNQVCFSFSLFIYFGFLIPKLINFFKKDVARIFGKASWVPGSENCSWRLPQLVSSIIIIIYCAIRFKKRTFFDWGSITSFIKEFDANKDGKVSKEELLNGVEKLFVGKNPDTVPGTISFSFQNDSITFRTTVIFISIFNSPLLLFSFSPPITRSLTHSLTQSSITQSITHFLSLSLVDKQH
jgi:hypothetical protein